MATNRNLSTRPAPVPLGSIFDLLKIRPRLWECDR